MEVDLTYIGVSNDSRIIFQWQDIKYSVTDPLDKSKTKHIVKGINGEIRDGEMIAILGPSGAGKTSFMDILAGRLVETSSAIVSGSIALNGEPVKKANFSRISGYDIFVSTATVREAIRFSARLRLPSKTTDAEVERLVDETINELGLSKVANSRIGSESVRGISGGEKKRTSVGIELVRQAKLLFLDEVTTGLDSAMSLSVVSTLRQIAENHRAIMCTLHQPRWDILRQFDKIMLLAQGNVVYFGPTLKAIDYFGELGIHIKEFENPGDFLLDHIRVNSSDDAKYENCVSQQELDRLVEAFKPLNKKPVINQINEITKPLEPTASWYTV